MRGRRKRSHSRSRNARGSRRRTTPASRSASSSSRSSRSNSASSQRSRSRSRQPASRSPAGCSRQPLVAVGSPPVAPRMKEEDEEAVSRTHDDSLYSAGRSLPSRYGEPSAPLPAGSTLVRTAAFSWNYCAGSDGKVQTVLVVNADGVKKENLPNAMNWGQSVDHNMTKNSIAWKKLPGVDGDSVEGDFYFAGTKAAACGQNGNQDARKRCVGLALALADSVLNGKRHPEAEKSVEPGTLEHLLQRLKRPSDHVLQRLKDDVGGKRLRPASPAAAPSSSSAAALVPVQHPAETHADTVSLAEVEELRAQIQEVKASSEAKARENEELRAKVRKQESDMVEAVRRKMQKASDEDWKKLTSLEEENRSLQEASKAKARELQEYKDASVRREEDQQNSIEELQDQVKYLTEEKKKATSSEQKEKKKREQQLEEREQQLRAAEEEVKKLKQAVSDAQEVDERLAQAFWQEKNALKEKLVDRDQEMESLNEDLKRGDLRNEQAMQQCSMANKELTRTREELVEMASKLRMCEDDLAKERANAADAEKDAAKAQEVAVRNHAFGLQAAYTAATEKLEKKVDEHENELERRFKELEQLKEEHKALQQRYADRDREYRQTVESHQKQRTKLKDAESTVKSLQVDGKTITDLKLQVQKLEEQKASCAVQNRDLTQRLQETAERETKCSSDLASAISEKRDLRNRCLQAECAAREAKKAEKDALGAKLRLADSVKEKEQELEKLRVAHPVQQQELEEARKSWHAAKENLHSDYVKLEKENSCLKAELDEKASALAKQIALLHQAEKEKKKLEDLEEERQRALEDGSQRDQAALTEKAALEKKLIDCQQEKRRLEEEEEKLKEGIRSEKAALKDATVEIAELERKVSRKKTREHAALAEKADLEQQLRTADEEKEALKKKLSDCDQEKKKLEEEQQRAVENCSQHDQAALTEIKALEKNLFDCDQEKRRLEEEEKKLKEGIRSEKAALQVAKAKIADLEGKVSRKTTREHAALAEKAALEQQLRTADEEKEALKKKLSDCDQEKRRLEEEEEKLKEGTRSEKAALQAALQVATAEIADLQGKVSRKKKREQAALEQGDAALAEKAALEQQLRTADEEKEALKKKLSDCDQERSKVQTDFDFLWRTAQEEVKEQDEKINRRDENLKAAKYELKDMIKAAQTTARDKELLQKEVAAAKLALADAERRHEACKTQAEKEKDDAVREKEKVISEMNDMRERALSADSVEKEEQTEREALKLQNNTLQSQLHEMQAALREKQKERGALEDSLELQRNSLQSQLHEKQTALDKWRADKMNLEAMRDAALNEKHEAAEKLQEMEEQKEANMSYFSSFKGVVDYTRSRSLHRFHQDQEIQALYHQNSTTRVAIAKEGTMTMVHQSSTLGEFYIGDKFSSQNARQLREAGITHIVSCLSKHEGPDKGYHVQELGAMDLPEYHILDHLPDIRRFLKQEPKVLKQEPKVKGRQKKTLVYCHKGINRSGALIVALIMLDTETRVRQSSREIAYPAEQLAKALLVVLKKHGHVLTNPGFIKQLLLWAHCGCDDKRYPLLAQVLGLVKVS